MADAMNFTVDVENYLSFQFDEHKNKMLALSLANPTSYETGRALMVESIRNKTVRDFYTTLMSVMTTGKIPLSSTTIIANTSVGYPKQNAAKFCISAAETLNQICVECVDIIMPPPYSRIALQRDSDLGKAMTPLS
jgi:hypothetical protein